MKEEEEKHTIGFDGELSCSGRGEVKRELGGNIYKVWNPSFFFFGK